MGAGYYLYQNINNIIIIYSVVGGWEYNHLQKKKPETNPPTHKIQPNIQIISK